MALTPVLSVRVLFCRVSVSVDISGQFTLTKSMNPFKGKRFGDAEIFVLNKLLKIRGENCITCCFITIIIIIENYRNTVIESKMYLRKHIGYIKI